MRPYGRITQAKACGYIGEMKGIYNIFAGLFGVVKDFKCVGAVREPPLQTQMNTHQSLFRLFMHDGLVSNEKDGGSDTSAVLSL